MPRRFRVRASPAIVCQSRAIRSRQVAELADDHLLLDRPDNARDDRGKQETGLAPGLDLVVSCQQPAHVARDGHEYGLSPALVIAIAADDQRRALFDALRVCKDELDDYSSAHS